MREPGGSMTLQVSFPSQNTETHHPYSSCSGFAMDRYAYYVCFKCGKAYFGGEARCDIDAGAGDTFNPEELVCGGCSDVSQVGETRNDPY